MITEISIITNCEKHCGKKKVTSKNNCFERVTSVHTEFMSKLRSQNREEVTDRKKKEANTISEVPHTPRKLLRES